MMKVRAQSATKNSTRRRMSFASLSAAKYLLMTLTICFILVTADALAVEHIPAARLSAARVKKNDSEENLINHEPQFRPNKGPELDKAPRPDEKNICLTPGCIHEASSILKKMDQNVKPCDDFYKFVCGNFLKNTIIPDDKTSVSTFSIVGNKLQRQLRSIVEEKSKPNEIKPFKLVKTLYKSCMNQSLIEEQGLAPLHRILKDLGGWPVLQGDQWNDGNFTWKDAVYKSLKMGYVISDIISFGISVDLKNSTRRVLALDQPSLELPRKYFSKGMEDEAVKAYHAYMVDVAEILGADRARADKELGESLDFEMKLSNISLPDEELRNATALYNPMTVRELSQKFPSVPWLEFFNAILAPWARVTEDELVNVYTPSFVSGLEKLLEQTPKRVQANYVMWKLVDSSVDYLTQELQKRELVYSSVITGRTKREPRWEKCVNLVSRVFSLSVGSLYVRKYFDEDAKKTAEEMVSGVRHEFKKILETNDWMDEETRKAALDKVESMSTHIAYPDELLNNTKLEEFYGKLEISPGNFLQSRLNITLFRIEYSFEKFRQPVNKSDWMNHGRPAIVNAFYSPSHNSIDFPAGILQGAFFSNDRPKYMNYGAIGAVMGHEITHGFDDQGRQFDKEGNLVDWWQPSTKEKYLKRAECIIHQYENYTVPEVELNLNGINTQGENIADNGGIKEAYLAYNEWARRNGPEPELPGLQYTPQQMFWISVANTECSKTRPEILKRRVTSGNHSPGEFRVLGPLSNMPEFAGDFQCLPGSKMNPENKCAVW